MFKTLIAVFCLTIFMNLTYADTSIDLHIKIDEKGNEYTDKVPRRIYPKFKTAETLLAAYAKAWNKEDYRLMYHLLSKAAREEWTFSKFKRLLKADMVLNGGLKKFSGIKQLSKDGSEQSWSIVLNYKRSSAKSKQVRTILIKTGDEYWFIKSGGLLPPDMSMFDR